MGFMTKFELLRTYAYIWLVMGEKQLEEEQHDAAQALQLRVEKTSSRSFELRRRSKQPASGSEAAKLRQGTYEHGRWGDTVCTICLIPFGRKDAWASATCGHAFHKQCVLDWWKAKDGAKCPACREERPPGAMQALENSLELDDLDKYKCGKSPAGDLVKDAKEMYTRHARLRAENDYKEEEEWFAGCELADSLSLRQLCTRMEADPPRDSGKAAKSAQEVQQQKILHSRFRASFREHIRRATADLVVYTKVYTKEKPARSGMNCSCVTPNTNEEKGKEEKKDKRSYKVAVWDGKQPFTVRWTSPGPDGTYEVDLGVLVKPGDMPMQIYWDRPTDEDAWVKSSGVMRDAVDKAITDTEYRKAFACLVGWGLDGGKYTPKIKTFKNADELLTARSEGKLRTVPWRMPAPEGFWTHFQQTGRRSSTWAKLKEMYRRGPSIFD